MKLYLLNTALWLFCALAWGLYAQQLEVGMLSLLLSRIALNRDLAVLNAKENA